MKAIQFLIITIFFVGIYTSCSQSGIKKRIKDDPNPNPKDIVEVVEENDENGPLIILSKPAINTRGLEIVPERVKGKIKIEGKISDESGTSSEIFINGNRYPADDDGYFKCRITEPSNNKIIIEASDNLGNKTTESFEIPKTNPLPIDNDRNRIAFVIGNADYQTATKLKNSVNDANSISNTLKSLGFRVFTYTNLDLIEFEERIDEFEREISNKSVSLFYFAGHGVQNNGLNYLIPVDANPQYSEDFESQCISINRILDKLKGNKNNANIVILDACRNNPFTESETSGFATMSAPLGTIIAFAADVNQVALDGNGHNGLFTQELLVNIKEKGLKIEDVFKRTRKTVSEKSGGVQVPTDYSKLTVDFYFKK